MLPQSKKTATKIAHYLVSLTGQKVEDLTPGTINRMLDRLDANSSLLTNVFIDEGRGYELPSETFKLSDPLAILYQQLHDNRALLHTEISRRYGPNAPSRLPLGKK